MKDLSQKTIAKIKEEHIKPTSKWLFRVEDFSVWLFLGLTVLIGAMAFSLLYYFAKQLDWDVINISSHLSFRILTRIIPSFWILLTLFLLIFSCIIYRHTKKGYRLGVFPIALGAIVLFLIIGFFSHWLKADKKIDGFLQKNVSVYTLVANNKEKEWSQPELGLLGGKIIQTEDSGFSLEDFGGEDWQITTTPETVIKPSVNLSPKETVKVVGSKKDNQTFQAKEIRPWQGKGMMRGKGNGSKNFSE